MTTKLPSARIKDLVGQKFGRLTVLRFVEIRTGSSRDGRGYFKHMAYWECRCDCGNTCIASTNRLKTKKECSCGCAQKEKAIQHIRETTNERAISRLQSDDGSLNLTGVKNVYRQNKGYCISFRIHDENIYFGYTRDLSRANVIADSIRLLIPELRKLQGREAIISRWHELRN